MWHCQIICVIISQKGHEVIVGLACGMSVLRGADVYVGGIMGAPHGNIKT